MDQLAVSCVYLTTPHFHCAVFLNIGKQNGLTCKDMFDINFLNETVWQVLVHFLFFFLCKVLHHLTVKWRNLKRHDWQINFSSLRHADCYLSQYDFFEQTLIDIWSSMLKASIISDHDSKCRWSARLLCEVVLRLCDHSSKWVLYWINHLFFSSCV